MLVWKYVGESIVIRTTDTKLSGIQDIVKWVNVRMREWDDQVKRMEDNRLAKIARDNRPQTEYVVVVDQRNDGKKVST
jgi:hypothetical protein